jgi:hypothetical protein
MPTGGHGGAVPAFPEGPAVAGCPAAGCSATAPAATDSAPTVQRPVSVGEDGMTHGQYLGCCGDRTAERLASATYRATRSNGGRCPNTRALQREHIDLLIALFSERKPMTGPANRFTVDRSSSPHEGAADGQQRQDPTDRPAHTWRTPCHADSGRRCRRCYCCRLDGMGNDRPLVGPLRPIG